jgi:hypothetical protein
MTLPPQNPDARSLASAGRGRRTLWRALALVVALVVVLSGAASATAATPATVDPTNPALGPNVLVFDPSMPVGQIQATVDAIRARQVDNEMGT